MVQLLQTETYEDFIDLIEELESAEYYGSVYIYFTASKTDDGSWCPACNDAWAVIQTLFKNLTSDVLFISAEVGNEDQWTSKDNLFRKDKKYKVKVLPTLLHSGSYQRLEGTYCAKPEIVSLMFEETEIAD
ncbi:hypothetical protein JTB14_031350 [Gonioctena quinquepunctata]|nr:hypothetical protein JTB14_031350 [Gonioctena quinquepunctata]